MTFFSLKATMLQQESAGFTTNLIMFSIWIVYQMHYSSYSQCIHYIIQYAKVKWIQSFADERCGGFGIVYQACSFNYYGERVLLQFSELDPSMYGTSTFTLHFNYGFCQFNLIA